MDTHPVDPEVGALVIMPVVTGALVAVAADMIGMILLWRSYQQQLFS